MLNFNTVYKIIHKETNTFEDEPKSKKRKKLTQTKSKYFVNVTQLAKQFHPNFFLSHQISK